MTSGNVVFNYGDGANAFVDVSSIQTVSAFTLTGASLSTGDIVFAALSATQGITFDVGSMSATVSAVAVDTDGNFVFNAGDANSLKLDIETLSASGATITLGSVSIAGQANNISATNVDSFTLQGTNYREIFTVDTVSASAMSITFGDLSDAFVASAITTDTFSFAGGDGANFSSTVTELTINGSDFNLTMPELGNGLTIGKLDFSASGTIVGTHNIDTVSASSSSTAGDSVVFTFNMGEDSVADDFSYMNGGGKELVKILNFDTGSDTLSWNGTAPATAITTTTAAGIIGGALGASISASDLTAGSATATFVYNGDLFFVGASAASNSTFEDGEVVFQFVGITDIGNADLGTY